MADSSRIATAAMAAINEMSKLQPSTNVPELRRRPSALSMSSENAGSNSTWPPTGADLEKQPLTGGVDGAIAHAGGDKSPQTFLYLGFGSNLAKQTFEGMRKVRPLAQINVHAPSYEITFDLPGIAYAEPAFANSRRRVPKSPGEKLPNHKNVIVAVEHEDDSGEGRLKTAEYLGWSKGLVGTVYEVTAADYKHIIETEGGGASYQDVLVECWPLPQDTKEVPDPDSYPPISSPLPHKIPDLSKPDAERKPFLAHTLLAPLPPASSSLYRRPGWGQPSARYIGLLRTGARERGLPSEYITWLDALTPFTLASRWQTVGKIAFMGLWMPVFLILMNIGKLLSNDRGQSPKWYGNLMLGLMASAWWSHDKFFKHVFGDGEHTTGS